MAIESSLLKLYQCTTWAEGDTHGGAISATEITDIGDACAKNIIFDDITDAQRSAGQASSDGTAYRLVYIKNTNVETWTNVKVWIDSNTLDSNGDPITTDDMQIAIDNNGRTALQIKPGGANELTFSAPTNKGTGLTIGNLAQNESYGVWIRRVVDAAGYGYTGDWSRLSFESA